SFETPVELSMVSSSKIQGNSDHKISIGSLTLLKNTVIYGANASGKTNLIDFFRFFKSTLEIGLPVWSSRFFCKNHKENETKESSFELQFSIENMFYAYGFKAVLSERKITGEWLYRLYQNGSSKLIFERDITASPQITSGLSLKSAEKQRFETYSSDFEVNKTDLFLAEMNRNKKIADTSPLLVFKQVYQWLTKHIIIFTPNAPITDFRYYYNADTLALVNKLIQTFDTGITDIRIEEISMAELNKMLPEPIFKDVMEKVRSTMEESGAQHVRMSMRSDTNFFNIEINGTDEPKVTTIKLRHGKSFFDFAFDDESDGTRRLFDLMDMLLMTSDDTVFIIDELERSLHPKLTERFLQLFNEIHKDRKVQLIFTTHEAAIMDQELFRRDEIWFVERSENNASSVYSLDRFKERYDKVLSKAYLEGRYGAIPVFKSFEWGEE
nr:ATP-binding protein [Lachnospiraceae bacterium]